jgi:hypothetical protein
MDARPGARPRQRSQWRAPVRAGSAATWLLSTISLSVDASSVAVVLSVMCFLLRRPPRGDQPHARGFISAPTITTAAHTPLA